MEFIKPRFTGSVGLSGSLEVTGTVNVLNGITGSLFGTASYALNAGDSLPYRISSGSATASINFDVSGSSSLQINTDTLITGSLVVTGSLTVGPNANTGIWGVAVGLGTTASGDHSFAQGEAAGASGIGSHAEGVFTSASGHYSHAEGYQTIALGVGSHAEGTASIASGDFSHAEGELTLASGSFTHAEGLSTIASGIYSHAEGQSTIALGTGSHAQGLGTSASGDYQSVQGRYNATASTALWILGDGTSNTDRKNLITAYTNNVHISGALNVSGNVIISGSIYLGSGSAISETTTSIVIAPPGIRNWAFDASGSLTLPTVPWNYIPVTYTSIPVTYGATELTFTVLPDNTITSMSVAVGAGGYTSGSINLTIPGTTFPSGSTPTNDIVFNIQTFQSPGPVYYTDPTSAISYVSGTPPQRYDNILSAGIVGIGAGSKHWIFGTDGNLSTPSNAVSGTNIFGTASHAATASYLDGFAGQGVTLSFLTASTTWSVNHGLNTLYPLVNVWESGSNEIIQPDVIESKNLNITEIRFTVPRTGYANIGIAGAPLYQASPFFTASFALTASFFSGSINVANAVSASYAATASYVANVGNIVNISGSAPTGSAVQVGDLWYDDNTLTLFVRYQDPSGSQWWVPAFNGVLANAVSSSYSYTSQISNGFTSSFLSQSTVIVNHNLNTRGLAVTVYDDLHYQVIPSSVQLSDNNNAVIQFFSVESGYVVVK